MSTTVADRTTTPSPSIPVSEAQPKVPTAHAVKLAGARNRRKSRHRMQRAGRIFAGKPNLRDRIATYPDKGWAALILAGTALVAYSLGCASLLVVEYLYGAVLG